MRPALLALAITIAAAALAACGEETHDTAKDESFIRVVVTRQIGARVRSVACPDGVKKQAGGTFACVVTGTDGSQGAVSVRQTDTNGHVRVTAPFLHPRDVEDTMTAPLARRVKAEVNIACQEIVVVKRNTRFTCTATTSNGSRRTVAAHLTDDSGRFSYDLTKKS